MSRLLRVDTTLNHPSSLEAFHARMSNRSVLSVLTQTHSCEHCRVQDLEKPPMSKEL